MNARAKRMGILISLGVKPGTDEFDVLLDAPYGVPLLIDAIGALRDRIERLEAMPTLMKRVESGPDTGARCNPEGLSF